MLSGGSAVADAERSYPIRPKGDHAPQAASPTARPRVPRAGRNSASFTDSPTTGPDTTSRGDQGDEPYGNARVERSVGARRSGVRAPEATVTSEPPYDGPLHDQLGPHEGDVHALAGPPPGGERPALPRVPVGGRGEQAGGGPARGLGQGGAADVGPSVLYRPSSRVRGAAGEPVNAPLRRFRGSTQRSRGPGEQATCLSRLPAATMRWTRCNEKRGRNRLQHAETTLGRARGAGEHLAGWIPHWNRWTTRWSWRGGPVWRFRQGSPPGPGMRCS